MRGGEQMTSIDRKILAAPWGYPELERNTYMHVPFICFLLFKENERLSVFQAIREQLVQLMFETFNISGFYASEQAVLSLYAVGRISGCTVDIGHGKIGTQTTSEQSLTIAMVCILTNFYQLLWNSYPCFFQ